MNDITNLAIAICEKVSGALSPERLQSLALGNALDFREINLELCIEFAWIETFGSAPLHICERGDPLEGECARQITLAEIASDRAREAHYNASNL